MDSFHYWNSVLARILLQHNPELMNKVRKRKEKEELEIFRNSGEKRVMKFSLEIQRLAEQCLIWVDPIIPDSVVDDSNKFCVSFKENLLVLYNVVY